MLESVQPVLGSGDVNRSCKFYEQLGFEVVFRDDKLAPKYAAIVREGVDLHLQWQSPDQFVPGLDRPTVRFVVHDVDALYAEFKSRGMISPKTTGHGPWRAPGNTPWHTREFHLRDPDGNGLHFYRAL